MKPDQRMIKFRVWDIHLNCMYYSEDDVTHKIFQICDESVGDVLMQFTGLKDENEKEIYEGDIIECFQCDSINFRHVVKFKNGAFGYCPGKYMFISFSENYNFEFKNGVSKKIKVVGNIYEDRGILIHD